LGGKSPLFNLGSAYNVALNATGGAIAPVDISSATELTIEFWVVPMQFRFGSGLANGATFFLGNENSYIRFSSYNGTAAINPQEFCFNFVIVINGVAAVNLSDTTASAYSVKYCHFLTK
jgi:hypothetical protein